MKLPLAYYGHPVLRKKAAPVELFDTQLRELIANMIETVQSVRGLGLSAPQVGVSKAIFIRQLPEEDQELGFVPGTPKVYINPKIDSVSDDVWFEEEGCLSIPKLYAHVERPLQVTITAQNEFGESFTETLQGWKAKVILHENDHLNGVLFVDRLTRKERKGIEKELEYIRRKWAAHNETLTTS